MAEQHMVKLNLTLEDEELKHPRGDRVRIIIKSLSLLCTPEVARRVFRAAADAAIKEKENGEDDKVGGTD